MGRTHRRGGGTSSCTESSCGSFLGVAGGKGAGVKGRGQQLFPALPTARRAAQAANCSQGTTGEGKAEENLPGYSQTSTALFNVCTGESQECMQ